MKQISKEMQEQIAEMMAAAAIAELGIATTLQAVIDNVTARMTPDCDCEDCKLNEALRTAIVGAWNAYVVAVHKLRNKRECTH